MLRLPFSCTEPWCSIVSSQGKRRAIAIRHAGIKNAEENLKETLSEIMPGVGCCLYCPL